MLGAIGSGCGRSAVRLRHCRAITASCPPQYPTRAFSSTDAAEKKDEDGNSSKRQDFVTTEIEPQVWDDSMTDPIFRPKFRSRAKVLSRHDYARKNGVTFEEQFQTFEDAGVTLTWMDHKYQRRIYDNYLYWTVNAQEKFGKTSHEYVCRLLAQKFHITPFRAAAIIQLMHNEEQYKLKNPGVKDLEKEADMMDAYMANTIKEAYRSTGETPPESFVESVPKGGMESHKTMTIDDVIDVDQLTRDSNIRWQERARVMLNDHPYIEDGYDEDVKIPMSKEAMNLIKTKDKLKQDMHMVPDPPPSPAAARSVPEEKKPRWKFVAQIVDTRIVNPKRKRKHAKDGRLLWGKRHSAGFANNQVDNTLIEEDGTLRPANLAEVRHMAWKPVRKVQEFTYAGVKKGWLDRTKKGINSAWGKAPVFEDEEKDEGKDEDVEVADEKSEEMEATGADEDGAEIESMEIVDEEDVDSEEVLIEEEGITDGVSDDDSDPK